MTRRGPFLRAFIAAFSLGAALGAVGLADRAQKADVAREANTALVNARHTLESALASELDEMRLTGHNAASNPRLVAALSGQVNVATLRDLVETESWWQPFRRIFPTMYVARGSGALIHISGPAVALTGGESLVERARRSANTLTELVGGAGGAVLAVAAPVAVPRADAPPVLVFGRPLDGMMFGALAVRSGSAVLLSDGTRVLMGEGAAAETARLKQAVGHEKDGVYAPDRSVWAAVALPAGPSLYLLGHVNTAAASARVSGSYGTIKLAAALIGCVLFGVALLGWRQSRHGGSAVPEPVAADAPPAPRPGTLRTPAPYGTGGLRLPDGARTTDGAASALDRYVLLEKLGSGGMAEVHLAVALGESGFRRPCVVKKLRTELERNPLAVARFTDEATLASSLVHSNIVPIYDFGRVGSLHFLVQEYIAGRDLARLSRALAARGQRLPPAVVAQIGAEACKALDYAHGKRGADGMPMGIVHRDVSPENIMATLRGEVKLLDFGVMKANGGRADVAAPGALQGNLQFMAPEQARGGEVDARADVFSLALVLYYCLSNQTLYGARTGYDLLTKASEGPGPDEFKALDALPWPLGKVLARALARAPGARYSSAALFAADLAPLAGHMGPEGHGAQESLGKIMTELFEDEIKHEQRQLGTPAAAAPGLAGRPATWVPAEGRSS